MKVGLGITTYNRPEMAKKCIRSVVQHCHSVDQIEVYNDGSDPKYRGAYSRAYKPLVELAHAHVTDALVNHGVAYAKNQLIKRLLYDGCDWIFLCEDDIRVLSPQAIDGYLSACTSAKVHHLSFAHHGPANQGGPLDVAGDLAYYPHSVGAWVCFSAESLINGGLFDENFVNAWEHVEHELRLMQAGFIAGASPHRFPDAAGSREWLGEIPGSLEKSSIRPRSDWHSNIRNGLLYWRDNKPETFGMLFGHGMPLEAYANHLIGASA